MKKLDPNFFRLVSRKQLLNLLGEISQSQLIRLEKAGKLDAARIKLGKRAIRYRLSKIVELLDAGDLGL